MRAYKGLSLVYDRLMADMEYDDWFAYYRQLWIDAGAPPVPARALDLCCGTGQFTARLAKLGSQVVGVDASAAMLRKAGENLRAAGVSARLVQQDMRRLEAPPQALVLCACDGMNYMTTMEDLQQALKRCHAALQRGGVLAFDCSSRAKLESMDDAFYSQEYPDLCLLWHNAYDRETRVLTMEITQFLQQPGGLFQRTQETHRQRAHSVAEITQALEDAGFADIRAYGERTRTPPEEAAQRIHFTARKP